MKTISDNTLIWRCFSGFVACLFSDWTRFSRKKSCFFWVHRSPSLLSASYLAILLWRKDDEDYFYPTLGSRGNLFLIDISRRSRVNEAQSAEEKKITSGHRSTQPHFHARSESNIAPIPRSEVVRSTTFWPLWWRVSLSIKLYTTVSHIRFVSRPSTLKYWELPARNSWRF